MNINYKLILIVFGIFLNVSAQSKKQTADELEQLYPSNEIVSRYHNDWTQVHYKKRIADFKKNPLEYDDIVFIGNSITEKGRNWSDKFGKPQIQNRGIAGDVTDGVLKRLDEITSFKPKAVFVLIGINDLFNKHHLEAGGNFKYDKIVPSTKYVAQNILKIAKQIHRKSSKTQIYIRTILPTNRVFLKEDILAVNELIKKNEAKGYYKVIDLFSQFVDSEGFITKGLAVDGIHLSEKGYEKWVKFEKPIIDSL